MPEPKIYLATYGTLREGYVNWIRVLQRMPSLGTFRVKGYHLYTNGTFPYAIPTRTDDSIVVDLFIISDTLFKRCDQLEGYPHGYNRRQVQLVGSDITPWMYFIERKKAIQLLERYPRIESGDFKDNNMAMCKW